MTRLYEEAEASTARAAERMVGSGSFGSLLGQLAENTAATTKLASEALDLLLRNLRLAGRRDVVRLSRQLARTEDKLERVRQEAEELRDALADRAAPRTRRTGARFPDPRRASRPSDPDGRGLLTFADQRCATSDRTPVHICRPGERSPLVIRTHEA